MIYLICWMNFFVLQVNQSNDYNVNFFYSGGGGGTPLYKPNRYVPPHRVGFLRCFALKTCIHFALFSLESSMVFEGTTGMYEKSIVSISNE